MRDVGMKITPGQRRGRGAGVLAQHGEAAAPKRELPPRAPDAQAAGGGAREGDGHGGRGSMSHTRYEPARPRLQRSELAVPGSQPAMFRKALESEADYVFLDLEDAVAPGDKEQARRNVIQGLLEIDWRERGKTICVRINGIDTHYMYRDVVDVVEQAGHRLDTVLIPKVGVPADVYLVDALLTQIEEAQGHRAPHRHRSPDRDRARHGERRGDRAVQPPAGGDALRRGRLRGELPRPHGEHRRARIPTTRATSGTPRISRMVVACRAYGLRPIDGPFGDFKDPGWVPRGRAARRRARHRGEVGDPPVPDRPGQRGVHAAAGRSRAGAAHPAWRSTRRPAKDAAPPSSTAG